MNDLDIQTAKLLGWLEPGSPEHKAYRDVFIADITNSFKENHPNEEIIPQALHHALMSYDAHWVEVKGDVGTTHTEDNPLNWSVNLNSCFRDLLDVFKDRYFNVERDTVGNYRVCWNIIKHTEWCATLNEAIQTAFIYVKTNENT